MYGPSIPFGLHAADERMGVSIVRRILSGLVVAGVLVMMAPASPASAYPGCRNCNYELDGQGCWTGGLNPYYIQATTQFHVSSVGRVHVNWIKVDVNGMHLNPARVDWDVRFKDTNARVTFGSDREWNYTAYPDNGETIRGLKTTVRGWNGDKHCLFTIASL